MAATKSNTKSTPTKGKVSLKKRIFKLIWKTILWFNIISLFFVILYKFIPVPFTPLMVIRHFENSFDGKDIETKHNWVPIEAISKNLQKAVIASEDGNFCHHSGFDFKAMQKAAMGNFKGKRLKGGSTISQQTAKNVFLWQGRSYFRKALEAYFTVLIEIIWGKERIMEVYLNVAETGKMTFGVEEACRRYYGHTSSEVSTIEAARIAACLPNPIRFSIKNPSAYVAKRTSFIKRQMSALGGKKYLRNL